MRKQTEKKSYSVHAVCDYINTTLHWVVTVSAKISNGLHAYVRDLSFSEDFYMYIKYYYSSVLNPNTSPPYLVHKYSDVKPLHLKQGFGIQNLLGMSTGSTLFYVT